MGNQKVSSPPKHILVFFLLLVRSLALFDLELLLMLGFWFLFWFGLLGFSRWFIPPTFVTRFTHAPGKDGCSEVANLGDKEVLGTLAPFAFSLIATVSSEEISRKKFERGSKVRKHSESTVFRLRFRTRTYLQAT
jgi:hypothetical protein